MLAGLVVLFADRPTGWTVLLIALVTGALMLGIEALSRIGRQAASAAGAIPATTTPDPEPEPQPEPSAT